MSRPAEQMKKNKKGIGSAVVDSRESPQAPTPQAPIQSPQAKTGANASDNSGFAGVFPTAYKAVSAPARFLGTAIGEGLGAIATAAHSEPAQRFLFGPGEAKQSIQAPSVAPTPAAPTITTKTPEDYEAYATSPNVDRAPTTLGDTISSIESQGQRAAIAAPTPTPANQGITASISSTPYATANAFASERAGGQRDYLDAVGRPPVNYAGIAPSTAPRNAPTLSVDMGEGRSATIQAGVGSEGNKIFTQQYAKDLPARLAAIDSPEAEKRRERDAAVVAQRNEEGQKILGRLNEEYIRQNAPMLYFKQKQSLEKQNLENQGAFARQQYSSDTTAQTERVKSAQLGERYKNLSSTDAAKQQTYEAHMLNEDVRQAKATALTAGQDFTPAHQLNLTRLHTGGEVDPRHVDMAISENNPQSYLEVKNMIRQGANDTDVLKAAQMSNEGVPPSELAKWILMLKQTSSPQAFR